jgi:NhaB family Na+:H+ antiporter
LLQNDGVAIGSYSVYHKVASGKNIKVDHDHTSDHELAEYSRTDLEQFLGYLRN